MTYLPNMVNIMGFPTIENLIKFGLFTANKEGLFHMNSVTMVNSLEEKKCTLLHLVHLLQLNVGNQQAMFTVCLSMQASFTCDA